MLERKKKSVEKKLVGNMFIKYDENDSDGTPQQSNQSLPAKMIPEIKQTTKFIQKQGGCSVKVDKSWYPHNLCINRVKSLKCSKQQLQNITSWRRRTLSSSIGSGRGQFRSWRSWGPTFCKYPSILAVFIKEYSRDVSNCFSIRSTARNEQLLFSIRRI